MMNSGSDFSVICLCAEWCTACREYKGEFEQLAVQFANVRFSWLDIEEEADRLGDLDIENFPTILVRRGEWILFFGIMLPQSGPLRRLLEVFMAQTPEESRHYTLSNPERVRWQTDADLSKLGRENDFLFT